MSGNGGPAYPVKYQDGAGGYEAEIKRLNSERDAAIRERDQLRVKRDELQTGCIRLNAQLKQKNAPHKTALEAAIKGMERMQAERDAFKDLLAAAEYEPAANPFPTVGRMIDETCNHLATAMRVADIEKRRGDKCFADRDAAIRERGEHKARVDYLERDRKFWCLQSWTHEQAANVLRARVAELESAAKLAPAANAEGGSNHAAPAASGAAGTGWLTAEEREAVLWLAEFAGQRCGLPWPCGMGGSFPVVAHRLLARSSPPEVVAPASYAVEHPQPPRGWLTEEERKTLSETADVLDDRKAHAYARFVCDFLARSSPPEVELPAKVTHRLGVPPSLYRAVEVHAALAAAGVTVKEVGK